MSGLPAAFDPLRNAYAGAKESINDIDVDIHGGRVYAASSSGEVLIWDIYTYKLHARLCHPQWVNAVRCFPPSSSAATCTASPLRASPPLAPTRPDKVAVDPIVASAEALLQKRSLSTIRWVLTASEDGVVAVWCPVTYRVQSMSRPGNAAVTALQLVRNVSGVPHNGDDDSAAGPRGGRVRGRRLSRDVDDDSAICCAASLYHVHVLTLSTASAEVTLLRSLQHHTPVTALTCVGSSASLAIPLLVVGQQDGTLCVWDASTWEYHDTMPYPTDEEDVDADAFAAPTSVHEPKYEPGRVFQTFRYNLRRCNPSSADGGLSAEKPFSPDPFEYARQVPATLSATAVKVLEKHHGALARAVRQELAPRIGGGGNPPTATPAMWQYDARRVTCLAASPSHGISSASSYLYSGHATGEVLVWESLRQEVPLLLLLKKVLLFKPGAWVWHMCATDTLLTSPAPTASTPSIRKNGGRNGAKPPRHTSNASTSREKSRTGSNAGKLGPALPTTATSPRSAASPSPGTTLVSPLELIVWSDGGVVAYLGVRKHVVTHREGPGFLSSAACCWIAPPMKSSTVPSSSPSTDSTRGPAQRERDRRTAAAAAAEPNNFSAHQYVIMGNFEGRVERFDITRVPGLIKGSGRLL